MLTLYDYMAEEMNLTTAVILAKERYKYETEGPAEQMELTGTVEAFMLWPISEQVRFVPSSLIIPCRPQP
jgi:hypothetical protein